MTSSAYESGNTAMPTSYSNYYRYGGNSIVRYTKVGPLVVVYYDVIFSATTNASGETLSWVTLGFSGLPVCAYDIERAYRLRLTYGSDMYYSIAMSTGSTTMKFSVRTGAETAKDTFVYISSE